MGFVGAVGGFIVGFIIGGVVLSIIMGDGRHRYIARNYSLKVWLGGLNIFIAFVGAWIGYRLLA